MGWLSDREHGPRPDMHSMWHSPTPPSLICNTHRHCGTRPKGTEWVGKRIGHFSFNGDIAGADEANPCV
jgi:hypothetical protein